MAFVKEVRIVENPALSVGEKIPYKIVLFLYME